MCVVVSGYQGDLARAWEPADQRLTMSSRVFLQRAQKGKLSEISKRPSLPLLLYRYLT